MARSVHGQGQRLSVLEPNRAGGAGRSHGERVASRRDARMASAASNIWVVRGAADPVYSPQRASTRALNKPVSERWRVTPMLG